MTKRLQATAIVRVSASAALAAAFVLAAATFARAEGTITIQHIGQNADTYDGVAIKVIHNTLNVTSPDGKGTLIITQAACFYQKEVKVCLPTAVSLVQAGGVHALNLQRGTLYVNMTDSMQWLPRSTTQLPPHGGIVMSLLSGKGTYINLVGKIDKVIK
jgi:hypothetical protein